MIIRKFLLLQVVVLGVLMFQGCGNDVESISAEQYDNKDVLKIYNEISKNIKEFSSVKAETDTAYFVNDTVNSLQLNMVTDIKQKKDYSGMEIEMKSSTKYMDKSIDAVSYYKDGYFYTNYNNEMIKYNIDVSNINNDNNIYLPDISETQIKSNSVEKEDDGTVSITIVAEPEVVSDTINKYIVDIMNRELKDVKISKFTVNVVADADRIIKSCDTLITINCNEQGNNMEYTVDTYIEYYDINEPVDISFPDFKQYKEVNIE